MQAEIFLLPEILQARQWLSELIPFLIQEARMICSSPNMMPMEMYCGQKAQEMCRLKMPLVLAPTQRVMFISQEVFRVLRLLLAALHLQIQEEATLYLLRSMTRVVIRNGQNPREAYLIMA